MSSLAAPPASISPLLPCTSGTSLPAAFRSLPLIRPSSFPRSSAPPASRPRLVQQSLISLFERASSKALVDRPLVRSGSQSEVLALPGGRLEVRPSLIPKAGRGLFALVPLKKGSKLGVYSGRRIGKREADRSSSAYLMALSRGAVIDGAALSNHMRWVNDAGSEEAANVRAVVRRDKQPDAYIGFYAKRDIAADQELYIFYGDDYWEDKEAVV